LTVAQQAASPVHDAVALFGFHTGGMAQYLGPEDLRLAPAEARANLSALTRRHFPQPYMTPQPPNNKRPVSAATALEPILMTGSMMAMVPNMIAEDAAAITVPVLLAFGDADLHGPPHATPAAYTGSSDVTLLVLRGTRHNHFIFPSRTLLFERVARWAGAV
jgi:hypothetical protein